MRALIKNLKKKLDPQIHSLDSVPFFKILQTSSAGQCSQYLPTDQTRQTASRWNFLACEWQQKPALSLWTITSNRVCTAVPSSTSSQLKWLSNGSWSSDWLLGPTQVASVRTASKGKCIGSRAQSRIIETATSISLRRWRVLGGSSFDAMGNAIFAWKDRSDDKTRGRAYRSNDCGLLDPAHRCAGLSAGATVVHRRRQG